MTALAKLVSESDRCTVAVLTIEYDVRACVGRVVYINTSRNVSAAVEKRALCVSVILKT